MKQEYEGIAVGGTMLAVVLRAVAITAGSSNKEATMTKVGRFVNDPRAGAHCQITLDRGEKLIVNHEKGGFKGGLLTIEVSKFMGFSSDRIFTCDLDSPGGQSVLAWLTRGAEPGSLAATPLGAAVEFVEDAGSLGELETRCAALLSGR